MIRRHAFKFLVVLGIAGLAFAAGTTVHHPAPAAPGPAACSHPSLPSGDQETVNGVIWTCTDGIWHTR